LRLHDVNVCVAAFRTDHIHHDVARQALLRDVNGESLFCVSPLVFSAMVRVTTNSKFMQKPSALAEAFAFCDAVLSSGVATVVEPGARHWAIFRRLCQETDTRGPRVTDAWLAALAIERGCTWVTLDRDFARFQGLAWSVPGYG
jgi:toxin-antitoxin system PIN domain toxin